MEPIDEEKDIAVCVGMYKTGTTSVGMLFEQLGYKSIFDSWDVLGGGNYDEIENKEEKYDLIKGKSKKYEGFADAPWLFLYEEMESWYPSAKFVLTTRNKKDLVVSELRQEAQHQSGEYELSEASYFAERYENHNERVRGYFSDKQNKFLEVDIDDPDIAPKICEFLGKEPVESMSHVNRGERKWTKQDEIEFRKVLHEKFGGKDE